MIDGIINVYKERGFTSHDVVAKLRGILKQKKIGHTGTLDPEAQGVLPVCLGKATKVCDLLTDTDKTYRAVLLLGTVTDTQDTTGVILSSSECRSSEEEIRCCISSFTGEISQVPPMYSALKVNGKKLYELARQGIEVERKARLVTIRKIDIEKVELPRVTMTVTCSKGTYIRTLCHDIGAALGCGGCMEELLRTKVGPFLLEESVTLGQIEAFRDKNALEQILRRTDSVFLQLPALYVKTEAERFLRNGNPLQKPDVEKILPVEAEKDNSDRNSEGEKNSPKKGGYLAENDDISKYLDTEKRSPEIPAGQFRVYNAAGEFLAVYRWSPTRECYRPVKMFL